MSETLRILENPKQLNFDKVVDPETGMKILPLIVVDVASLCSDGLSAIRMQGWANREAVEKTIETKTVTFWSRSQQGLWTKGETSGNTLDVVELYTDCDFDSLLVDAVPTGPTCHTGTNSCFNEIGEST